MESFKKNWGEYIATITLTFMGWQYFIEAFGWGVGKLVIAALCVISLLLSFISKQLSDADEENRIEESKKK